MARPRKAPQPDTQPEPESKTAAQDIASALLEAIRQTQPMVKKTQFNKQSVTPWSPKAGARSRLKRKAYHHSLLIGDPKESTCRLTNEEIDLFNQLKPGNYCNGYVKVTRRRDKGIDIDYPIRTASQRLRLVNDFGIRSFTELLQRCVWEAAQPKTAVSEDDE